MPPTDRYVSTAEFHVRYAETDAQGIVHHASFVIWMEEARSHYARSRGTDYADFERAGLSLSVAELQVRYGAPARYGDVIAARCWVKSLGSRAVTFAYEIANARTETVFVTGESRHICLNREGRPVVIPTEWRPWMIG
jgi:acyl-CoA thioester hydrolase